MGRKPALNSKEIQRIKRLRKKGWSWQRIQFAISSPKREGLSYLRYGYNIHTRKRFGTGIMVSRSTIRKYGKKRK